MQTIISAAVSLDGYLDDTAPQRLMLSSPEDYAAVGRLRAQVDAILIGAETLRRDNPSLATRDPVCFELRQKRGLAPHPLKIVVTRSGRLPQSARFFHEGDGEKLVICGADADPELEERLGVLAEVWRGPHREVSVDEIVDLIGARGVKTLLVEGGAHMIGGFLAAGMADYLRLAIAPVMLGARGRARLWDHLPADLFAGERAELSKSEQFGDTLALTYRLK